MAENLRGMEKTDTRRGASLSVCVRIMFFFLSVDLDVVSHVHDTRSRLGVCVCVCLLRVDEYVMESINKAFYSAKPYGRVRMCLCRWALQRRSQSAKRFFRRVDDITPPHFRAPRFSYGRGTRKALVDPRQANER